jgi:hypothetical protein
MRIALCPTRFAFAWTLVSALAAGFAMTAHGSPPAEVEARDSAQAEVRRLVWSGFDTVDEIVESVEWAWAWDEPLDVDWLREEIAAEFAKKQRDEAAWPAVTDVDRLARAFDALNAEGVIALHNAGYTQQDGMSDVSERYHDTEDPAEILGWCFYTGQDIEGALESEALYIAFGIFENVPDEARSRTLAERVKTALEREGFRVAWDGDLGTRLEIAPLRWQKRHE